RHTRSKRDWSSDVCSSDLRDGVRHFEEMLSRWRGRPDVMERVTTQVECSAYFEQRNLALLAHATQIDPNGWFFAAPVEMQQRVWPTEEFELAASRVAVPERAEGDYEADLFEGVDPNVDLTVGPSTSEGARWTSRDRTSRSSHTRHRGSEPSTRRRRRP